MYSAKLRKRFWYHFKLGKEMFISVLLYIVVFAIANLLWPQSMEYELFSVLNQLALPFLSCMWMNGSIREWIEEDSKEMLLFYSHTLFLKQVVNILSFQILLLSTYFIACQYGYEKWENWIIECIVCFGFQAIYSLGMLLFRSSTLILFVITLLEGWNIFAYFQGVTKGYYMFLNVSSVYGGNELKKYLVFLLMSVVIWCVYCLIYWIRKKKGQLCG